MANHKLFSVPVLGTAGIVFFGALMYPCYAQSAPKPAEESRLSTAEFHAGLKKRGLTDLLEQHVKDFPPASPTEASLLMRDVKLAESADQSRSFAERQAAIASANDILEQLIADRPQDPSRFEWKFSLAHSLLHRQAEPFLTALSYRGAVVRERDKLLAMTSRAVSVLAQLADDLRSEYDRIDALSIGQFEKLEANGYVAQLDALGPRSEYLTLWALLYDSLPRDDSDSVRATQLHDLLERITAHPTLIRTPHEASRVQVQALLLTGMTYRLLNKHHMARQHLERAVALSKDIDDEQELQRIDWAILLAWLELIRNEVDVGAYDDAMHALGKFREHINSGHDQALTRQLMVALAERGVFRKRADTAERSGSQDRAAQYRREAWNAVARLADQSPAHRDAIYSTLYEIIDPKTPISQLDPLEQSALIAGLLSDARKHSDHAPALLDRVVLVGERFLDTHAAQASTLIPEVLHNLGVAEYRRGRTAAAAQRFIAAAEYHATFANALQAATFAVQLGSELYADPALINHPEIERLYRDALELLLKNHADSEPAEYWRFYYAQLLDESGNYLIAARQYDRVGDRHEHHLVGLFYRTRCLARFLQQRAEDAPDQPAPTEELSAFFKTRNDFIQSARRTLNTAPSSQDTSALRSMLAETKVLMAEVQILAFTNHPKDALESIAGFEELHPDETGLEGRIWRVRMLAYEKLGRLEEAMSVLPQYIASDAANAAATLQNLYLDLVLDLNGLHEPLASVSAANRSDAALAVAQALSNWSERPGSKFAPEGRRALTLQLAEAHLRSNQLDRAAKLFASLATESNSNGIRSVQSAPAILGYAETLYRKGDFAAALPRFNQLATGLNPGDERRWQALLRDLQCRDALLHPPQGIIRVIQQQNRLHPKLGGAGYAAQFEKLLRACERRRDQGTDD